jgi:8-oxo-dGTP pyrophosphatase MutT (NUDIX family)
LLIKSFKNKNSRSMSIPLHSVLNTPKPLRCACLVAEQDDKLLLVRVRQNEHWYLPGGKIDHGESPEQALQRELLEELGILIDPATVAYLYTVIGPAYGQAGEVELICFTARWDEDPQPHGEISEVQWLPWQQQEKFAPAVQILCNEFLARSKSGQRGHHDAVDSASLE